MRPARSLLTLPLLALLLAPAARSQNSTDDDLKKQVEWMKQQMEQMAQQIKELQEQAKANKPAGGNAEDYYIPRLATEFEQSGQSAALGNVYTKPFLTNLGSRTYLGGYVSMEASTHGEEANGEKAFNLTPFVPFIYSDVTDRVKFASEIEIDNGFEFELEYGYFDYLFNPAFNTRWGVQLLPVGKFNEVHDAPIQELTKRPLVDSLVIPTTLRDVGVGVYGSPTETVSYQATVTNGFRGLDNDGNVAINLEDGMHDAAPQESGIGEPYTQLNDSFAVAGRLAVKPVLGMELGASALSDKYDQAGDNGLNIYALDATVDGKSVSFLPDALTLLGEAAWDDFQRDDFAQTSGVPDDFSGFYVQANYRFEPEFLKAWESDGTVDEGARFTFVTRYDRVHLDTYERSRTTLGLNFRPNANHTVFKLDYQFNSDSGSLAGENNDNTLLFSAATYF
jgi:hypothetical protein